MRPQGLAPAANEAPAVATALRRLRARAALWLRPSWWRDGARLLVLGLRGQAGVPVGVAVLLVALSGLWLSARAVSSPHEAHAALNLLFLVVTVIASAGIFSGEQRHGTFELLWLAIGSRGGVVRHKMLVLMTILVGLALPPVLVASWFLGGDFALLKSFFYLVSTGFFCASVMAYFNARFPQAWAGAILGAIVLSLLYAGLATKISFFNPFLNPYPPETTVQTGGGAFAQRVDVGRVIIANRVVVIVAAALILRGATRELRRLFR